MEECALFPRSAQATQESTLEEDPTTLPGGGSYRVALAFSWAQGRRLSPPPRQGVRGCPRRAQQGWEASQRTVGGERGTLGGNSLATSHLPYL